MERLTAGEADFLAALSDILHTNPFQSARIDLERRALGADFDERDADWNLRPIEESQRRNVDRLIERADALLGRMRAAIAGGARLEADQVRLLAEGALFVLYHRHTETFSAMTESMIAGVDGAARAHRFEEFKADVERDFAMPGLDLPELSDVAHLFACLFQVRRAYHLIQRHIIGASPSVARLRAEVWQSVFSHDMRRHRRMLFQQMGEYTTLVTGPSGSGKELVARAVGLSRYLPFNSRTQSFQCDLASAFQPINLAALPSTLVESTLFGHRRGAFTGAIADQEGVLASCPVEGAVFLDEIGDLDPAIQVKLLRVLQTRSFQAIGDTKSLAFRGKLIAATNRDLAAALAEGALREDFYYRLCADTIETPSLAQRIAEEPEELSLLVRAIARRMVGEDEAGSLTRDVERAIRDDLPPGYTWPGNVRELEQCVQNVLLRGSYRPLATRARSRPDDHELPAFLTAAHERRLTADQLLGAYCAWVYAETGSYAEVARRLGLDRRTVRARIDEEALAAMRPGPGDVA